MAEFQPPEGLQLKISDEMVKLYRDGWNEPPIPTPPAERVRAGLAAVLAGCEVRERWGVRWIWGDGHRAVGWYRDRAEAETERDLPHRASVAELVRRCDFETQPEPVSSTGEEGSNA